MSGPAATAMEARHGPAGPSGPIGDAPPAALPALRQDLELLPGPLLPDGSPSWRIRDPARNRFFEIGPLEFALLSEWQDARSAADLLQRAAQQLQQPLDEQHLLPVLAFLQDHELLAPDLAQVRNRLYARHQATRTSALQWLLHHYLFFRIPLWHPERWLDRVLPRLDWVFSRRALWLLGSLLLLDAWLLTRHASDLGRHVDDAFSWSGLVWVAAAGAVGKVFHELGHALTARRYGVRVPTIGVAFLVMFPMLYTDTGDSWRLADRWKRFAITAAGMGAELVVAVVATLGWCLAPDGVLRTALFNLAFVSWVVAVALNASPFMRFDGYYLLSDALNLPNLHERAAAVARHRLRRVFFGLDDPAPEPALSARAQRGLFLFAIATMLYRLMVFIAIALIVYHAFFKLLGIVLFVVEIGWFIVRPAWLEVAALMRRRSELRPRWPAVGALGAALLCIGWGWLLATSVSAPALLHARVETELRAPAAGLLVSLPVRDRQRVQPGELLAVLASPESALKAVTADIRADALSDELSRIAGNALARERSGTLREERAGSEAQGRVALSESDLLRLRPSAAGTVRDIDPTLQPGRWVRSRELLMRVVSEGDSVVDAFVPESHALALQPGAAARFYPEDVQHPVLRGRVVEVDSVPMTLLPSALLASIHGGPIAAQRGAQGELLPQEARFRVRIALDEPFDAPRALRGQVRIEGDGWRTLLAVPSHALSALWREAGF